MLFTAGAEVPPPGWRRPEGAGAGFYRSEDSGASWSRLTGGLPERIGPAPRSIAVDPASPETVFVGLNDGEIWASRDGGEAFDRIVTGLPPRAGDRTGPRLNPTWAERKGGTASTASPSRLVGIRCQSGDRAARVEAQARWINFPASCSTTARR